MNFWGSLQVLTRAHTRRKSHFWPNKLFLFICLSFARLLLLPKSTKVSFGVPFPYKTARIRWDCGFLGGFWKILVYASHNFAFEITLSRAITLTLLLVCAFSPRVHSIPRGPINEFSGSVKTPKRRELSPFYKKNFGRAHVCSPRRLPEIISKCYDCGNAACW